MLRLPLNSLVRSSLLFVCAACASTPEHAPTARGPIAIATWPFGALATDIAHRELAAGSSRLDAVELGIREVERQSSDRSVGLGGLPNAAGYPQLDACILDGPGQRAGSVAALEGIVHPISAARAVLEHSAHVMLVGEGARWFALERGLESVDVSDLAAKKAAWLARTPNQADEVGAGHDTVTVLVQDSAGHLAGGCSTSGRGGKLPGRVGDSPILGAGLYVDDEVGAAGATGLGENVMRWCGTFLIVELMRQGFTPTEACEEAIHRIARLDPRGYKLDICFLALDKQGRFGAAASNDRFPFSVTTATGTEVLTVEPVRPR